VVELKWQPVEWTVIYPVNPNDPIGHVRLESGQYRACLGEEDLGPHSSGDAAVEAIWERFLEANRVRHAAASVTHGGHMRHTARRERPNSPRDPAGSSTDP
jgi:hypothetical protein